MNKFGKIIFWLAIAVAAVLLIAWAFSLDIILGLLFICCEVAAIIDDIRENKDKEDNNEKKDNF